MWLRVVLILAFIGCLTGNSYGCPVAVIAFDPNAIVCHGTSITCDGSGSYDNDSSGLGVVSWKWDMDNDGSYDDASGESVSFPFSSVGTYTVGLKVTDGEGETATASATLHIVTPSTLTSGANSACVDCNVTFTLTMNGGGVPDSVHWSAPGGDPSSKDGGSTFKTHWSATGLKTVTVTVCSTNLTKNVAIADVTNFHQTLWLDLGNGQLYFEYEWQSTSGNLGDLTGTNIQEKVTYPGANPYVPDNPPFASWSFSNPTITSVAANTGGGSDTHGLGGGFSTPYCAKSFTGTQYYRRVNCDSITSNLMGPLSIVRSVYLDGGTWKYKVEKSGHSAIKSLP